jgi:hypothetical protein
MGKPILTTTTKINSLLGFAFGCRNIVLDHRKMAKLY